MLQKATKTGAYGLGDRVGTCSKQSTTTISTQLLRGQFPWVLFPEKTAFPDGAN